MIKRTEHTTCVEYTLNDTWHRPNGPAVEWADGEHEWYINGFRHRYYGPAWNVYNWWFLHDQEVK